MCSSGDEIIKDFVNDDIHLRWDTIIDVYKMVILRVKYGQSRQYSYVDCDAWTRLNVKPAKIMHWNSVPYK